MACAKKAGKVLAGKDKEDKQGDPWILIRFSSDHSPECFGILPELEDAGDDLRLRELSGGTSSARGL
jgi:hypothetical protein